MKHIVPSLLVIVWLGIPKASAQQGETPEIPPGSKSLQQYEAVELPTIPGYPYPRVRKINNSGHVAGTNYACPFILSCLSRAFLYDGEQTNDISAEIIEAIPPELLGAPVSLDMNNADQVLIRLAVPGAGLYHYLWDDGEPVLISADPDDNPKDPGPLVPIPPPPGTAWALNDSGIVAGSVSVGEDTNAFLWERERGVIQLISAPPGYTHMGARGINSQGHVVGNVLGAAGYRAFLWIDGEFTILQPLAGHSTSGAISVNDDGYVVGTSTDANFLDSLVLWHDGEIVDFVTLDYPSGLLQFPETINAAAEVVGYYWPTGEEAQHFGFRWTQDDGFLMFNGTIENIPDLNVWAAEGVNDAGQIAAWGDYPDFTGGGFILTPIPEIPADLDGDGIVGTADLLILLGNWGQCAGCPADLDGDGNVGIDDLLMLLASWT